MKDLYIIGAGSVGGHVSWNLDSFTKDYKFRGFFDDDPSKIGTEQFGHKVIGPVKDVLKLNGVAIVIGIAFPKIKKKIVDLVSPNTTFSFPTLIHDLAWVSNDVTIGKGSIIYPGTAINFGSEIGDFVVMNMNCSLGHHTKVGNFSSLAPGVNTGGHTYIEEGVDVGIGASTIQDIRIGSHSMIGGQSMVIENVKSNSKVAGIPAKEIK